MRCIILGDVITVRVPQNLSEKIKKIQRESKLDRANLLRKIIEKGLKMVAIEIAIDKLVKGEVSMWKAAEISGLTLWEMLDEIKKRKIVLYTEEDLGEDIEIVKGGL